MGPVTLTRRFSQMDDDSVSAVLSFDTGKRRWTPSELEQVWDGLEKLDQESVTVLSFEPKGDGAALAAAGAELFRDMAELPGLLGLG